MNNLKITLDVPDLPRKVNARPSRHCFSLTMDEGTHLDLVDLQAAFTTRRHIPSRTVVARLAIRHLARTVRSHRGQAHWFDEASEELLQLARSGIK